jgi:hypothetical protein
VVLLGLLDDLAPSSAGLGSGGCRLIILSATLDTLVVSVTLTNEEITEELAEVRVIGLVVEAEGTSVVEEGAEFVGEATAEEVGGGGHLLLHNAIILLLLGGSLETLPGEGAAKEVHEDVGKGFEIVTAGLLNAQVGADGGVAGGTGEVLVLAVGDVGVGLESRNFFARPKSMTLTWLPCFAIPIRKLLGLTSWWMKLREWMYSMREI